MAFRVVDQSSFTFRTDVPESSRNIHPSGVLHAFRNTPPNPMSTNSFGREEHAFAWITNVIHTEEAIKHMESCGFDRSRDVVFIPYSTKQNWLDRYPHAAPAMETTEDGQVVVYLNWRPYPNGLGELGQTGDNGPDPASVAVAAASAKGENDKNEDENVGEDENGMTAEEKDLTERRLKRRKYRDKSRPFNIVHDETCLSDLERDELHVEMYNYFTWLQKRLGQILQEERNKALARTAESEVEIDGDDNNEGGTKKLSPRKRRKYPTKEYKIPGVDVRELKGLVSKMETSFMVVGNLKSEKKANEGGETPELGAQQGKPFLEEALSSPLKQLVAAREVLGKPQRRSRKRQRIPNPDTVRCMGDWDDFYERMVQYKEQHGDCCVSKSHPDKQLYNWIRVVRERKATLAKEGLEFETIKTTTRMSARTLTAERVAQLNSIEFTWSILQPKIAWEDRYQEVIEYYNEYNKWPSQSMGGLGLWVHKQRQSYKKGTKKYMETKAPKLDEIGFEWTPRGNTRMSWDEGFELLMEFERTHGHFDVPRPEGTNVDKKGEAYRLYNWVHSLHMMYRSYKLGRKSGSLTDERVMMLMNHGFEFREI